MDEHMVQQSCPSETIECVLSVGPQPSWEPPEKKSKKQHSKNSYPNNEDNPNKSRKQHSKNSCPNNEDNPNKSRKQHSKNSYPNNEDNPNKSRKQHSKNSCPNNEDNPNKSRKQHSKNSCPNKEDNPNKSRKQHSKNSCPNKEDNPNKSRLASHRMIFKEGLASSFPVVLVLQVFKHVGVEEDLGMNTTSSSAAMPANLCKPDPCGTNLAECIALHSIFTCQCRYGFYYSNKDCHKGQIFPGVITLKEFYNVQTVNSVQYEEVFQNITTFFKDAFNNSNLTGFGQTVIVEIQSLKDSRASLPVNVTVTNLFMENSTVDNETVTSAINNAAESSSYVSQYRATTYCAAFNCDVKTTHCKENVFPKCICKSGFSKTEWDDRSCSDCSEDCSAEENKYCVNERGIPTCKCMPNFESNNEKCVSCPVGYSGENCKNNSELILIIVGTVFGAIILSLVIAVSIVSARAAKHKQHPEKKSLIKSRYSNSDIPDDRQTTIFPRVQTTSGHANPGYQPNNPYEMHSSNRGHFLERDYDDLYKISREPESFRMQSRY
ncbi:mucin-13 [Calonectris borealis]|uniref:mucin-13 n=1 Tax=Calonectris borealis TaxID=1323832 RepID=UPI003F4B9B16